MVVRSWKGVGQGRYLIVLVLVLGLGLGCEEKVTSHTSQAGLSLYCKVHFHFQSSTLTGSPRPAMM